MIRTTQLDRVQHAAHRAHSRRMPVAARQTARQKLAFRCGDAAIFAETGRGNEIDLACRHGLSRNDVSLVLALFRGAFGSFLLGVMTRDQLRSSLASSPVTLTHGLLEDLEQMHRHFFDA